MDNHIDNALDELKKMPRPTNEKTSKIVDNVQEELAKGREEIADHQKKIKMADRSEYSWGMVELATASVILRLGTNNRMKLTTKNASVPVT